MLYWTLSNQLCNITINKIRSYCWGLTLFYSRKYVSRLVFFLFLQENAVFIVLYFDAVNLEILLKYPIKLVRKIKTNREKNQRYGKRRSNQMHSRTFTKLMHSQWKLDTKNTITSVFFLSNWCSTSSTT